MTQLIEKSIKCPRLVDVVSAVYRPSRGVSLRVQVVQWRGGWDGVEHAEAVFVRRISLAQVPAKVRHVRVLRESRRVGPTDPLPDRPSVRRNDRFGKIVVQAVRVAGEVLGEGRQHQQTQSVLPMLRNRLKKGSGQRAQLPGLLYANRKDHYMQCIHSPRFELLQRLFVNILLLEALYASSEFVASAVGSPTRRGLDAVTHRPWYRATLMLP